MCGSLYKRELQRFKKNANRLLKHNAADILAHADAKEIASSSYIDLFYNREEMNSPATTFPQSVISNSCSLAANSSCCFSRRFLDTHMMTIMMMTTRSAPAPASPPIKGQLVVVSGTMNCGWKQARTIKYRDHLLKSNEMRTHQCGLIK